MVPRDFGNGDRTPEYTYPVIVGVDGATGLNLLHHSAIPVMICHSIDADG